MSQRYSELPASRRRKFGLELYVPVSAPSPWDPTRDLALRQLTPLSYSPTSVGRMPYTAVCDASTGARPWIRSNGWPLRRRKLVEVRLTAFPSIGRLEDIKERMEVQSERSTVIEVDCAAVGITGRLRFEER